MYDDIKVFRGDLAIRDHKTLEFHVSSERVIT